MKTKWNKDHCEIRDYLEHELGFKCNHANNINHYSFGVVEVYNRPFGTKSEKPLILVNGDPYGKWDIWEPVYQGGR